ncbi:hypothetical protein RJ640_027738 [Escallonia rubra]|uniref:Uncharacterized protein n=1 Tax=Escallonia rubra TaxID=112253 RepID=A0AA88QEB2_9ASTE|nr:hypothetical protein RJ640_027738 [Escallonia rubra]
MGEEKAKPAGVWPTVKPFVNGGASGMLATCVMIQPIDMIKVRIQLGQGSAGQVTRTMLKNEGIGAFYESSHFGVVLVHKALSITGEVLQGDSYGMAAVGIDAGVESTKNYVEDKDEWLGFFTEKLTLRTILIEPTTFYNVEPRGKALYSNMNKEPQQDL